jgi:ketosteroid isomerase-like protein
MKVLLCLLLLLCPLAYAAPCPKAQPKDENALAQAEQAWAHAIDSSDAAALACLLADEFEDAGPDGDLTSRSAMLAKTAEHRPIHHELAELHAHVYGDFGYIRGLAMAKDADGTLLVTVRFTDIYVYREGRWQCVAGHESLLPGKSQ